MRSIVKRILHPFLKRWYRWKHRKPRQTSYKGVEATILPGVFSPTLTLSTRIFIDYLETQSLQGKKILELGAGSGLIASYLALQGAEVIASDISDQAIAGLAMNGEKNGFEVRQSDLFENIPESFDLVIINPPYYPKNPQNDEERAWFCGSDFEYFRSLFAHISARNHTNEEYLMILSNDCDQQYIKSLASTNGTVLNPVYTAEKWKEINTIFRLENK